MPGKLSMAEDKKSRKDEYAALRLDNQLCFPLYVCAKEIVSRYTPYLEKLDLTYTQYITMMVMWEEEQVLSRRLKERLFLDSGTLTPVLKRLEEKGYIKKERSAEDARDLVVSITEKGKDLEKKAVSVPQQAGMCVAGFEDATQLQRLLREMMDIFRKDRCSC